MIHTAADIAIGGTFNDCVSCHVLGSAGQMNTTYGVINIITSTHECDECHPAGNGLPPEVSEDWPRTYMINPSTDTNAQLDMSCIICHAPAK
jgi:hypothetical protein